MAGCSADAVRVGNQQHDPLLPLTPGVVKPSASWPLTDGVVTLRPPEPGDTAILIAGRDEEWERWLGPGDPDGPRPTACAVVDGHIVGWVDCDPEAESVGPGEANIGYNVFPAERRNGYATRAIRLLFEHLRNQTDVRLVQLTIGESNVGSIAVADALGAVLSQRLVDEDGRILLRYVVRIDAHDERASDE